MRVRLKLCFILSVSLLMKDFFLAFIISVQALNLQMWLHAGQNLRDPPPTRRILRTQSSQKTREQPGQSQTA